MEIKKFLKEARVIEFCICLFGFFPLLPEKIKGLPVIILIIFSLFFNLKKKRFFFNFRMFTKLSSLYLVNLLSVLYTGSFYFPINKMETTLALLIVPLAFSMIDIENIKDTTKTKFLKYFIFSTTILSIISIQYYYLNDLFREEFFKVNSFRGLILDAPFFGEHPIYISFFLGISILIALTHFSNKSKSKKLFLIISCLINTFHLLLLASKGVIIAMILSIILFVFFKIKSGKNKVIISLGVLGLFLSSIFLFPNMERRFREFGKKTTYTQLHITNSSSVRIAIYKCAVSKVKESPIMGYGWGNGINELLECYKDKSDYLFKKRFNSHNQYFGYYIDGGIIAFFVLIIFISNQFKSSIFKKEYFFSSFLLFSSVIMFTENILDRQSGVIIFIFFASFFAFYNSNSKQID